MDKILCTFSYGICVFSLDNLKKHLKEEKIRTKKLLALFQKDKKKYLLTQEKGIWIPIPQISAGKYIIKVKGIDTPFSDEWGNKFEYEGFNIEITNGVWISDIESLVTFQEKNI